MLGGTLAAARVLEGHAHAVTGEADLLSLIRTTGLIIVAIIALVFLIQNLATIEVAFLTWSISAPRAVVFLMVFAMGLIAGYLLHALRPQRRGAPHETKANIVGEQDAREAPTRE
jgi:putative membrane protein